MTDNLTALEEALSKRNNSGNDWWQFCFVAEREVPALIARIRAIEGEHLEQSRLLGISAERELAMAAKIKALEADNEALKAARDDDGELLTIAWMDGSHRSTKAHRERIKALEAENERLRKAAVEAIIPLEAMQIAGTTKSHSRVIREAINDGIASVRAALEASDGDL